MKKTIVMSAATFMLAFMMSGCTAMKLGVKFMGFSPETQEAYAGMMDVVSAKGDPAQAMMKEWEITDKDLTEEAIFEDMKSLAGDYNMRFVGEKNMFRLTAEENPTPDKVVHARIAEFCSLSIAKKMLNHSRFYGGFMPCRVLYVEYGDGRRYLISMDMTLALYGGTDKKPINAELMEDMKNVKKAMEEIPAIAAGYDIEEKAEKKD
jgi:hypothetical protein